MKVLLVGESWVSEATHYKGFDSFTSVTFHSGADWYNAALRSKGIDVEQLAGAGQHGSAGGQAGRQRIGRGADIGDRIRLASRVAGNVAVVAGGQTQQGHGREQEGQAGLHL